LRSERTWCCHSHEDENFVEMYWDYLGDLIDRALASG